MIIKRDNRNRVFFIISYNCISSYQNQFKFKLFFYTSIFILRFMTQINIFYFARKMNKRNNIKKQLSRLSNYYNNKNNWLQQ